jgi:hypothetical protein
MYAYIILRLDKTLSLPARILVCSHKTIADIIRSMPKEELTVKYVPAPVVYGESKFYLGSTIEAHAGDAEKLIVEIFTSLEKMQKHFKSYTYLAFEWVDYRWSFIGQQIRQ